jgi:Icc-related predicted phosphoesterase
VGLTRDLEDDLEKKMQDLKLVENPERRSCAIHVPPVQSGLDTCPELDKNLKIVTLGGQVISKAAVLQVRNFIEHVQPLICGHITVSGHTRTYRTLCINAGSEYADNHPAPPCVNLEAGESKGLLISG